MAKDAKKSWSEAFKDPKVLVVLIPLTVGGLGSAGSLLMEIGELRSDVGHYQTDVESMHELIVKLTNKCGN